jgi:phosphoribosylglycinamide formyltransferase-1
MRLGILVSGRGSNLAAVLAAVEAGRLPGVTPVLVVSNRAGARALEIADRHRVPAVVLPRAAFANGAARDAAIGRALADSGADLALLAGYDQLLDASYFAAFTGRSINVHPSLLPRHGGRGMIGASVHAAVLAAGDRVSGATVHEVTPELDAGPILAQARVPVAPDDTAERLAERVLAIEHRLVVEVLGRLSGSMAAAGPSGSMTAGRERRTARTPLS